MATKQEKERMADFLCGLIYDSQRYDIIEGNYPFILVGDRQAQKSQRQVLVMLHADKDMTLDDYAKELLDAKSMKDSHDLTRYICDVFYNDGKTFHVSLADQRLISGSMHEYDNSEKNRTLHLRGLERAGICGVSPIYDHEGLPVNRPVLLFYQPRTQRFREQLVGDAMEQVSFNYSHQTENDKGYGKAKNGPSKTYWIAHRAFSCRSGPVHFKPYTRQDGIKFAVMMPGNPK